MTIFETVKEAVTPRQIADHYGFHVNRSNMICCPFHQYKRPSMKLNRDYFYCFGCQESGDVIQFVAKLQNTGNYEAAKLLADDFGLQVDDIPSNVTPKQKIRVNHYLKEKQQQTKEQHCIVVLCNYLHLLEHWKKHYAPKHMDEEPHDYYVEACQMMDYVENLVDQLLFADLEMRNYLVERLISEGTINHLETKVKSKKRRDFEYER